jgi:hypothetical protein
MARAFRSQESLEAEDVTRKSIICFMETSGFTRLKEVLDKRGTAQQQILYGLDPDGDQVGILVRCTWYKASQQKVAASQLVRKGADEGVQKKVRNAKKKGVTHFLFAVRTGDSFKQAAYLPIDVLYPDFPHISKSLLAN